MKRRMRDITILIVGLLLGVVPVMAVSYIPSRDVSYRTEYNENVTNVEEALDTLINQVKEINNTGNSVSSDILSGKTAYVNGKLLTGTMANYGGVTKAANNITESGTDAVITIPGGYYDANSKITIPIDTINSNINNRKLLGKKLALRVTKTNVAGWYSVIPCEMYKEVTLEHPVGADLQVIYVYDEDLNNIGTLAASSTASITLDITKYSYLRLNSSAGEPVVYFTFIS